MDILIVILLIVTIIMLSILIVRVSNKNNTNEESIKGIVGNEINRCNSETTIKLIKELSSSNEVISNKFNNLTIALNSNLNSNNEKVIIKFSELEKRIANDLGENTSKLVDKFGNVEKHINKDLSDFSNSFKENLDKNIDKLMVSVEGKLNNINDKVEERLKVGFEKTTETFNSIIERLAKIDEAQKNIESLSGNIISLQDILNDKKTRGVFGEVQLNQILYSVFGEQNDKTYRIQYKLAEGRIADSVLFAPEPMGTIAIDSKFPLENYKRMMDKSITEEQRKVAEAAFKINIKKHIDDISSKYIVQGVTSDQAILFLPAEAIFAELNAYHGEIVEYGYNKRVWIASPTTLMALLNTLQIVLKDAERQKYAKEIQEHLGKLGVEFDRYKVRWDSLAKDIDKVSKDVKEINTTSNKISKKFKSISNAEMIEEGII